jgi:hypothetical protein
MSETRVSVTDSQGNEAVIVVVTLESRPDVSGDGGKTAPSPTRYFLEGFRGTYGEELVLTDDGGLRSSESGHTYLF